MSCEAPDEPFSTGAAGLLAVHHGSVFGLLRWQLAIGVSKKRHEGHIEDFTRKSDGGLMGSQ